MTLRPKSLLPALLLALAPLVGCDSSDSSDSGAPGVGSGNTGGSDVGGFQLSSISVGQGDIHKINIPITFVFTRAVSFSTVNLNTIAIRDEQDVPANGVFTFDPDEPRVVVFQPTCPVEPDFSDAGLLPGGRRYTIEVLGEDGGQGIAVASAKGELLEVSQSRTFFTPATTDLASLFSDPVNGAPLPVVRAEGSSELNASYVEVGRDSSIAKRIYFERDPNTQVINRPGSGDGSIPDGHPLESLEDGMPLNLFSQVASQVAFVVEMNQPVNPRPVNINTQRVQLQAEQTLGAGDFLALPAVVELVQNCTESGATLRITPRGVLPQDVGIRILVAAEFEDLAGNTHLAPIQNFARIQTRNAGAALADEVFEPFDLPASNPASLEDGDFPSPVPLARWRNGRLSPGFEFQGSGGPNGDFDYVVSGSATIDTTFSTVQNATQTQQQTIVNGRMDVRNFTVMPGATLNLRGPNPMRINATGTVRIDGQINLQGFSAKDVAGVNTATSPEEGAGGNLGGGRGGNASVNTTTSTPRGNNGNGAFGVPGLGGRGGETGFGAGQNPKRRRGAGGGGGRLGADVDYGSLADPPPMTPPLRGTVAQSGGDGSIQATGAINGGQPQGGTPGISPFVDTDPDNDFFGVRFDSGTGEVVQGELSALLAGQGGGGGGDNVQAGQFPHPNFNNTTDEKGGAGGGGSGALQIRALGDVDFGAAGRIVAEGGDGAKGQTICFNTCFDGVGASGGGGSGGHVVIETAGQIDLGNATEVISARGGSGGPGTDPAAGGTGGGVGQQARGGNGGPGLVQLHAPGGAADIFPSGGDLNAAVVPPPVLLVPNFGAVSRARSEWIPLGGAVGDDPDDVTFLFDGTDPMTGEVQSTSGMVDSLPAVIGPATLAAAGTPRVVGAHTLAFDFANDASTMFAMDDLIYRDNPVLMRGFLLVLRDIANPQTNRRYIVETAMIDPADTDVMRIVTPTSGLPFSEFTGTASSQIPDPTDVEFFLVPRFFRVVTNGVGDSLPANSAIRISFEGTNANFDGSPNTSSILVPSTTDIEDLFDRSLPEPIRFFRFQVEFDLDANSAGLSATAPRPTLDFLRMPFRF